MYLFASDYAGNKQQYITAYPQIVYGITDNLSLFVTEPVAISYEYDRYHSAGLGDLFVQLEYVYYSKQTKDHADTATLVMSTSFPTGSINKNPATGYGAQTFFLGGTFSRLYADWFGFFSPGFLATTSRNGTSFGNNFLYQFGIGKNISYETSKYILSWLVELNGTYYQKNHFHGQTVPNTGGNLIYVMPSIWYSTPHLILQGGVGWAVEQNWNGHQQNSTYLLAADIGWTF